MTAEVMGPVNRGGKGGKVLQNGPTLHYFSECLCTRGLLKPAILPDGEKKKESNSAWTDNEFIITALEVRVRYLRLGTLNFNILEGWEGKKTTFFLILCAIC